MSEVTKISGPVHGYKVFDSDWTCRPAGAKPKQYTCPGKFEEEGKLEVCCHGMHFCQTAADCFNYYDFDSENKVAEVIAYGEVLTVGDKSCTDKLEIVREIPWDEVLRIINLGKNCTGNRNTGTVMLETGTQETGIPGTGTPGPKTPGTVTLGTGTLGIGTPGFVTLETGTPETGTPETTIPETTTQGIGIPGIGTPGTTTPGTRIQEIITLGIGTLGIGIRGIGTSHLLILAVSIQKNRRYCCSINRQI